MFQAKLFRNAAGRAGEVVKRAGKRVRMIVESSWLTTTGHRWHEVTHDEVGGHAAWRPARKWAARLRDDSPVP